MIDNKSVLRLIIQNTEIPGACIGFTGDAISYCGQYLKEASCINLDDWEWYKEIKGGKEFYIITGFKNANK